MRGISPEDPPMRGYGARAVSGSAAGRRHLSDTALRPTESRLPRTLAGPAATHTRPSLAMPSFNPLLPLLAMRQLRLTVHATVSQKFHLRRRHEARETDAHEVCAGIRKFNVHSPSTRPFSHTVSHTAGHVINSYLRHDCRGGLHQRRVDPGQPLRRKTPNDSNIPQTSANTLLSSILIIIIIIIKAMLKIAAHIRRSPTTPRDTSSRSGCHLKGT